MAHAPTEACAEAPVCADVGGAAALRYHHVVVRDADECSASLDGWQQHYQQLGRGAFVGQLTQARWSDGALIRECTNRHMLQRMCAPAGGLVFGIAAAVAPGSLFDRRALTPNTLLVLQGGREHELLATGPTEMLGLHLGAASLAAWADAADLNSLRTAAQRGAVELAPQSAAVLRQGLRQGLREAQGPCASSAAPRQAAEAMVQAVCARTASPTPRAPRVASERSHRTLTLALAYMQAHLGEDIRIGDLCRASHASASLLHHSFKVHRGCSAHRCLQAMRLSHARRALRRDPQQSITGMAHALRFSSASHFSAQYRALFGETPSSTQRQG